MRTGAVAGDQPGDGEADKGCAIDGRREGPSMEQPAGGDDRRGCLEDREPPKAPFGEHGFSRASTASANG